MSVHDKKGKILATKSFRVRTVNNYLFVGAWVINLANELTYIKCYNLYSVEETLTKIMIALANTLKYWIKKEYKESKGFNRKPLIHYIKPNVKGFFYSTNSIGSV
jgi:hypothetical protein